MIVKLKIFLEAISNSFFSTLLKLEQFLNRFVKAEHAYLQVLDLY